MGERELIANLTQRLALAEQHGPIADGREVYIRSTDLRAAVEALASRPAVAEGWVAEMTGYQEWLRHLSQGFLMSEPLRRQACADLIRVTALLSAAPKP